MGSLVGSYLVTSPSTVIVFLTGVAGVTPGTPGATLSLPATLPARLPSLDPLGTAKLDLVDAAPPSGFLIPVAGLAEAVLALALACSAVVGRDELRSARGALMAGAADVLGRVVVRGLGAVVDAEVEDAVSGVLRVAVAVVVDRRDELLSTAREEGRAGRAVVPAGGGDLGVVELRVERVVVGIAILDEAGVLSAESDGAAGRKQARAGLGVVGWPGPIQLSKPGPDRARPAAGDDGRLRGGPTLSAFESRQRTERRHVGRLRI